MTTHPDDDIGCQRAEPERVPGQSTPHPGKRKPRYKHPTGKRKVPPPPMARRTEVDVTMSEAHLAAPVDHQPATVGGAEVPSTTPGAPTGTDVAVPPYRGKHTGPLPVFEVTLRVEVQRGTPVPFGDLPRVGTVLFWNRLLRNRRSQAYHDPVVRALGVVSVAEVGP